MESLASIDPKLVVTTETLSGYRVVQTLGTAEGIGLLFGTGVTPTGQKEHTTDAMREAYQDMMESAKQHGAQAIVGVRYCFHSNQVIVYGTAVTIRREGF